MSSRTSPRDLAGRRVLITGASAGLGEAFAHAVARRGGRPVLVARRRERLTALAAATGGQALPLDLAAPDAADALLAAVADDPPAAAILNAAAYEFGDFADLTRDRLEHLLSLNVLTLTRLTHGLLGLMADRPERAQALGLLVVASTGGLMPAPGQALYAATKAFACNLALSLYAESAVPVCLCAPGGMPTALVEGSGVRPHLERNPLIMKSFLAPEVVAEAALRGFLAGQALTVPGRLNQAMVALAGWLPRSLLSRGAARVYGRGRPG